MAEEDEDVVVGAEKVGKSEDVAAEKKDVAAVSTTVEKEEDGVEDGEAEEDVVAAGLHTREDAKREEETRNEAIQPNGKTEVRKQYNPAGEKSAAEEAPEPAEKFPKTQNVVATAAHEQNHKNHK